MKEPDNLDMTASKLTHPEKLLYSTRGRQRPHLRPILLTGLNRVLSGHTPMVEEQAQSTRWLLPRRRVFLRPQTFQQERFEPETGEERQFSPMVYTCKQLILRGEHNPWVQQQPPIFVMAW